MTPDPLRESLGQLAESVQNVDLYDRALRRSGRIGRNRAGAVAGAALAVLGLAGAGLLIRPVAAPTPSVAPPSLAAPPIAPSVTPATPPSRSPSRSAPPSSSATTPTPPVAATTAVPQSRSLSDLPGRVFYRSGNDRVVRLTADGAVRTVLETPYQAVAVSPGGDRIAYVAGGDLLLAGSAEPLLREVDPEQLPAWSPDGTRLIVAAPRPGVLTLRTGDFVRLPDTLGGQHLRWSGDGRRLIYATPACRLKVAAAQGRSGTTVPVIGDPEGARNPDGSAVCRPLSADRTGRRITAPLDEPGGPAESGLLNADVLVDTETGDVLPLPVSGQVTGLLFGPDGNLLIRTAAGDGSTLSVLAPDGRLLVSAREPAGVGDAALLAYTR